MKGGTATCQEGVLERGKPLKSQRCAGGFPNRATKRGSLWWINSTEESEKGRGVGVRQTTKFLAVLAPLKNQQCAVRWGSWKTTIPEVFLGCDRKEPKKRWGSLKPTKEVWKILNFDSSRTHTTNIHKIQIQNENTEDRRSLSYLFFLSFFLFLDHLTVDNLSLIILQLWLFDALKIWKNSLCTSV